MLNRSLPLVLADEGYLNVYRYYAIRFFVGKAYPNNPEIREFPSQSPIFMEKYRTRYLDSITNMLKKFKTAIGNVILARDDSRRNLFRTQQIPSYKADRIRDVELNKVLAIAHRTIIPSFLKVNDINSIGVKGLEADDVIACAALHALRMGWEKVYILSADKDLSHLTERYDKIQQFTLTGKQVISKQSLLEHIVLGDTSDNISSCLAKGQGLKYLHSLLEHDAAGLKDLVKRDDEFSRQFRINKFLIDFDCIPKKLRKEVEIQLEIVTNHIM